MRTALLITSAAALLGVGCNGDPGNPAVSPLYRNVVDGEPSSGERGSMQISEIHYAGSVSDEGVYDADDVFIELWNKHPRPINVSGWRLEVDGDFHDGYRIPDVENAIQPNGHFVIARRRNGAFADVADAFIDNLELGKKVLHVELRDHDRRLMEDGGSTEERVFTGGYDGVTVRSMERSALIFGNRGSNSRNWHAYSDSVGFESISEGYRLYTLASPGSANSADYSGNASSGGFE
jgi:hypothetical protein